MVSYLFECDENKLFLKYIKETLLIGVVDLFVTICLYFVSDIKIEIWLLMDFISGVIWESVFIVNIS